MSSRPLLLDLCCKAGGASVGYARAGFEVVGVDLEPQPNYPYTFHQTDALTFDLTGFDAVHVSPPCQGYSTISACRKGVREKHPRLITAFREKLVASGLPYVIENVAGAMEHMQSPIMLCGNMFGLRVYRHRLFESNITLIQPDHVPHVLKAAQPGAIARVGEYWSPAGNFGKLEEARRAMGIDWTMTRREVANAIPPDYTEWIGRQLLQALSSRRKVIRVQMCECGCGQMARSPVGAGRPGRFATDVCRVRAYRAKKQLRDMLRNLLSVTSGGCSLNRRVKGGIAMIKVRFEWKLADMWVGAYWRREQGTLHIWICFVPCLPLHLQIRASKGID